tara:strand:+ start:2912 stop:3322 length:411 start_codon:yes stop_codon:yes gene_type:complete
MIISKLSNKENTIINFILEIMPKIFNQERDYLFEHLNAKNFIKKINSETSFTQGNPAFSERGTLKALNYKFNRLIQVKLASVKEGIVFYFRKNSKTQKNKYSIVDLKCTKKIRGLRHPYWNNKLYKIFYKTSSIHK